MILALEKPKRLDHPGGFIVGYELDLCIGRGDGVDAVNVFKLSLFYLSLSSVN